MTSLKPGSKKTISCDSKDRQLNGQVSVDKDGFLVNLQDWSPQVGQQLAAAEDIVLNDRHWEVIHLLRDFYHSYGLSPTIKPLVNLIKQQAGVEKGNSIYLLSLFRDNPVKLASKIAGLPRPTNCL